MSFPSFERASRGRPDAHEEVRQPLDLAGSIPVLSREFITQRIRHLEQRKAMPDAVYEKEQILAHFGETVSAATRIDLSIRTHDGREFFFEIKSGKPNKGQCIEMKQRLMTALAIRRTDSAFAYWGIPYNPYGRAPYVHAFALPFFDFANEVMIGEHFWDFVGGAGTYQQLLELYRAVGEEFSERLRQLREQLIV